MKIFTYIKQNSERVPGKNFQDLGSLPLWMHLCNNLAPYTVYIDTDSPEVILASKAMKNVIAYERDPEHIKLETDPEFGVSPALLMIYRFLDEHVERHDEIIVTPHVTSPFLRKDTVEDAVSKITLGHDVVQACTVHHEFAYYKGQPVNFDPAVVQKTQDLEPIVMGNGAFFIFRKKTFIQNRGRSGKNTYFYPLSMPESIEIDTIEDLNLARKFL